MTTTSTQTSLSDVAAAVEQLWPGEFAADWDVVGTVLGSASQPIQRGLLVVDVTESTVEEAISGGYDVIVAHHPLLLRGVTELHTASAKGALVSALIRANVALISAHTNADAAQGGVADVFAAHLGLSNTAPIVPIAAQPSVGIGRVGQLVTPLTLAQLAERIVEVLPATPGGVRVAGDPQQPIRTVALCPGAGDSLLNEPAVRAADAFVTADLRHHPVSESRELSDLGRGPALIDVSHWASEWLWLPTAKAQLSEKLADVSWHVSEICTDAWSFVTVDSVRRVK